MAVVRLIYTPYVWLDKIRHKDGVFLKITLTTPLSALFVTRVGKAKQLS
jgi:hypothetical protein